MVWKWNPISPPSPTQQFIDVGAPLFSPDPTDQAPMYLFWVGSDNTLWRLQANGGGGAWQKIPVPTSLSGPVTRIAVAPDNTAWCIDRVQPYFLPKGEIENGWKVPLGFQQENVRPIDVCVAKNSSIWIASTNTQQWVARTATDQQPFTFGIPLTALAGKTAPVSDSNVGVAWGVIGNPSRPAAGGTIALCNGHWPLPSPGGGNHISEVVDISTSPNHLWMVKTDGTVLSSPDGISGIQMGDPSFRAQRITGGYVSEQNGDIVYCVGQDGLPYVWTDG